MTGPRGAVLALAMGAGTVTAAPIVLPDAPCDTPAGRVAAAAHAAGLPADRVQTAVAVALAESGGDPAAVGDTTIVDSKWGPSVGVWQVRSLWAEQGTGRTRDADALTDLAHNARSMVEISGGGENWQPWSVYTNGRYLLRMDEAASVAGCSSPTAAPAPATGGGRPDALELANRAATNLIYGVGDRACPTSSAVELCARWRAFTAATPASRPYDPADARRGMVDVDGITVTADAAPSLRRMLAAARADGVTLTAVSSLRSSEEQAALRARNCPDPVNSAPSECSPATARVGTSAHETGRAVDFASNGWDWLAANAERFGWAMTVPSEPWHAEFVGAG